MEIFMAYDEKTNKYRAYDGSSHKSQAAADKHDDSSFTSQAGFGAAKVLVLILLFLAAVVFLASNIVYIIILGAIYAGRIYAVNKLREYRKPLIIRMLFSLVTLAILVGGFYLSYHDRIFGVVPVIRSDASIETQAMVFRSTFSRDTQIATVEPGDEVEILGVTKNHSYFRIKTSDGITGFTSAANIQNSEDYLFFKRGFWRRMMEFDLAARERPLIPGMYESSRGDLALVMEQANSSRFKPRVFNEDPTIERTSFLYVYGENEGSVEFHFRVRRNRTPVELNGARFNYSINIEMRDRKRIDAPEVVPFLHYLGDYTITSRRTFVRDDIVWTLTQGASVRNRQPWR